MTETPINNELDLAFTYLIFQPNPKSDKIFLWLDGEKVKKTLKTSMFCNILQQKNPHLLGEVQQVLNTYSFYMIKGDSDKVIKLTPSGKSDLAYQDPVVAVLLGRPTFNNKKPEPKSLMDVIGSYGFAPVSAQDANELRVSVIKKDIDEGKSLLSKVLNIGKSRK